MITSALMDFTSYMQLRALSPVTITDRIELLDRLALFLAPVLPLDATTQHLVKWQRQFARLAPATVDIYTRHAQAFYRWALADGRITTDPAAGLPRPHIRPGRPHPTSQDELRTVFRCATGTLRVVFALAAFAGLRRGEICRLQRHDIDFDMQVITVDGKGGKERRVPLIEPLAYELRHTIPRHGYVVVRDMGLPYTNLDLLSGQCARFLRSIGVDSTLHSMRHAFATNTYRATRDLLFVSELLGHASARTTQIYAMPDMDRAQERMRPISDMADVLLNPERRALRAV